MGNIGIKVDRDRDKTSFEESKSASNTQIKEPLSVKLIEVNN